MNDELLFLKPTSMRIECYLFEDGFRHNFTIDGKEVGLYFVEPGDYCGELCI